MLYYVTVAGHTFQVELGPDGVRIDGEAVATDLAHVEGGASRSLLLDGASHRLMARRLEAGVWDIHLGASHHRAEALDERLHAIREMTGAGAGPAGPAPVRAPMPGLVLKVEVAEGDVVEPGQGVVVVEAMKMENELKAEAPGVVSRVHVVDGDTVERDQVLVELSPSESAEEEA